MHSKENLLRPSNSLAKISLLWLLSGITLGLILNTAIPTEYIEPLKIYSSYTGRIEEKNLLKLTALSLLALSPIIMTLMRACIFNRPLKNPKEKLFILLLACIALPFAIDIIPTTNTTKYYKAIEALTNFGDWAGALIVIFLYTWTTVFLISAATTKGMHHGRKLHNHRSEPDN